MSCRCCSGLSLLAAGMWLFAIVATPARAAIIAGQTDDFENATVAGWTSGGSNPNPAANVSTGGPAGDNDNFMRLTATGSGSGGRLVAFNSDQWTGDFRAAHVDEIRMEVNSFSIVPPPTPQQETLKLRLILIDSADAITLCTLGDVSITPGSGWQSVTFPLTAANLSGGDVNTALAHVTEMDLVHSPTAIFSRQSSPPIVAQLGVDNIRAVSVPEPTTAVGVASVALAALIGGGRGCRSRA